MRQSKLCVMIRLIMLAMLMASLATGLWAQAQNVNPQEEGLPEELANLVSRRWETIKQETANLPADGWAGVYRAENGPTTTTHLAWSPTTGFMVWWENCSRPWQARVNYGAAQLINSFLRLTPQLSEDHPRAYATAPEYVPVKWGEQRFLIPSDRLINFSYAVNSTSSRQIYSFLVNLEDYQKPRSGLPNVPPEYRRYLRMRPLAATITGLRETDERWYPRIILNIGRADGVVPQMNFYLSRPRNIYMLLEVTDVQEHSAEAFVIRATFKDGREAEVVPQVGWRLTSRAPADDSQYGP